MTPEQRAKEEWIKRYQHILGEIESRKREQERLRDLATSVSPNLSGMPGARGDHSDKVGKSASLLAEMSESIDDEIHDLIKARNEIIRAISSVDDIQKREILERKYIAGEKIEHAADQMHYSRSWIYRLRDEALDKLPLDVWQDEDGQLHVVESD